MQYIHEKGLFYSPSWWFNSVQLSLCRLIKCCLSRHNQLINLSIYVFLFIPLKESIKDYKKTLPSFALIEKNTHTLKKYELLQYLAHMRELDMHCVECSTFGGFLVVHIVSCTQIVCTCLVFMCTGFETTGTSYLTPNLTELWSLHSSQTPRETWVCRCS